MIVLLTCVRCIHCYNFLAVRLPFYPFFVPFMLIFIYIYFLYLFQFLLPLLLLKKDYYLLQCQTYHVWTSRNILRGGIIYSTLFAVPLNNSHIKKTNKNNQIILASLVSRTRLSGMTRSMRICGAHRQTDGVAQSPWQQLLTSCLGGRHNMPPPLQVDL